VLLLLTLLLSPSLVACRAPAPSEPLAQAETVLRVGSKAFSMADLKALEQVTAEADGKQYSGVRLLDVLKAAGIQEGKVVLSASDGYSAGVAVAALDEQCLLAYNQKGGVDAVMPGMDKGLWVRETTEIKASTTGGGDGPAPTLQPVTGETKVVTDSVKREVTIPKQVNRVASLRSGITEIICALGQKDKIIAVDEMVQAGSSYGAFITSVHPDLKDCASPIASHDINVEEMLRLAPDLVLHGGYGRIKQAEALMKQVPSLPVVIAHFETIEDYMDDIRLVAQCVNAEERAEPLITCLYQELDSTVARVKDVPENRRVRVFYGGHDIYHAYTPGTFEHSQIVMAGGVNVAESLEGWLPEVSAEQLLRWDPQVVVLLHGADVDEVLGDKRLAGLSAVQNKRVYALPEASWDFSSPRALFCIKWLATKFYPDRFSDVDIYAEADAFYQEVFGVDYAGPALTEGGRPPAPSGQRTITDMNKRRVKLPATVSRVVSLHSDLTYAILGLGGQDVLVGVDSTSPKNARLAGLYPDMAKLPDVGSFFSVNQESVLLTRPDVVLTVGWQRDVDKLQQSLGVPVVCVDSNYYKESLSFVAQVLGADAEKKAKVFLDYYDGRIGEIAKKTAAMPKTTVYIAGGSGLLSTYGKESTWQYEIQDAGGVNVAADIAGGGAHEVSVEQVITWNPDVIILDQSCTDTVADLMKDMRWQSIAAVKDKRVYRAPDGYVNTFGRPHLESAFARVWLADKLYPGKLGLDIVQEAKAFYQECLGLTLSDSDVSGILNAAD